VDVVVFGNLDAANIGYKITQRLALALASAVQPGREER